MSVSFTKFKHWISGKAPINLSLKTVLAVYFLPIAVLPTILLSYYVVQVFEDTTKEGLARRAQMQAHTGLFRLPAPAAFRGRRDNGQPWNGNADAARKPHQLHLTVRKGVAALCEVRKARLQLAP